jgi:hypothetical protein
MGIHNKDVKDKHNLEWRNYVRSNEDGVEKIPANEDEDIKAVADMIIYWNACTTSRNCQRRPRNREESPTASEAKYFC